jgi:hypothetical protein
VTLKATRDMYGVVLDNEMQVDVDGTSRLRREMAKEQFAKAKPYDLDE